MDSRGGLLLPGLRRRIGCFQDLRHCLDPHSSSRRFAQGCWNAYSNEPCRLFQKTLILHLWQAKSFAIPENSSYHKSCTSNWNQNSVPCPYLWRKMISNNSCRKAYNILKGLVELQCQGAPVSPCSYLRNSAAAGFQRRPIPDLIRQSYQRI